MRAHSSPAEARSVVDLRYFALPEPLQPYFGATYCFTAAPLAFSDVTRADVPQLRFMIAGTGHYLFHDGREIPTPPICLLGPTMGATAFHLQGPTHVLGISLLPRGWLALGLGDASALADGVMDIAAERDPAYAMLRDELALIADPEAAASAIWSFLAARMRPVSHNMARFVAAVDTWLAEEGSPRVAALVEATGLSDRQIARLTNRLYGGPPKSLARKYRALRCAARIVIDRQPWQELCDDGTFYDQSHFIREIKHFIGLTPHQLMTGPSDVTRLTLQRRGLGTDVAEINRIS